MANQDEQSTGSAGSKKQGRWSRARAGGTWALEVVAGQVLWEVIAWVWDHLGLGG